MLIFFVKTWFCENYGSKVRQHGPNSWKPNIWHIVPIKAMTQKRPQSKTTRRWIELFCTWYLQLKCLRLVKTLTQRTRNSHFWWRFISHQGKSRWDSYHGPIEALYWPTFWGRLAMYFDHGADGKKVTVRLYLPIRSNWSLWVAVSHPKHSK